MIVLDILKQYRLPAASLYSPGSSIVIRFVTAAEESLPNIFIGIGLENKPAELASVNVNHFPHAYLLSSTNGTIGFGLSLPVNGNVVSVGAFVLGLMFYADGNLSSLPQSSLPLVSWTVAVPLCVKSVICTFIGPSLTGLPFAVGDDLIQNPNVRAV